MVELLRRVPSALLALSAAAGGAAVTLPAAHADNQRLNTSVAVNVYTLQHQAGCTNDVRINPQLQLAAEWHTDDVLNNRELDGDIGSDGTTPQDRAHAAGYSGTVAETVAINPAMAINGIDILNQWYYNPDYYAVMSDCANTEVGVWSANSMDRSVVVAVYGRPPQRVDAPKAMDEPAPVGAFALTDQSEVTPIGSYPDYDASDELEFGLDWLPWILRGVYPPPAYPPA